MNVQKDVIKLYTNYLSKKYDDNISNLAIDVSDYRLNNNTYKGVHSFRNKFRTQLSYKGNVYSLGVFADKLSAAKKYALVHKLLTQSSFVGGKLTFATGNENSDCKKDEDCKDSFPNPPENSKNICNKNTGMCENVIEVFKYINPEEEEEENIKKTKKKKSKKIKKSKTETKSVKNKKRCPNGTKKSSTGKTCRKKLSKCKKGSRRTKSGKMCKKK